MQKIAIDFLKSEYAIYDMPLPVESEELKKLTKQFAASHLFFAVMLNETMIGHVCFPDENYDYDELAKSSVFVGAYDGDKCINVVLRKNEWHKFQRKGSIWK